MGRQSELKAIRGQLRQIVKEMTPELIKSELYKGLQQEVRTLLGEVQEHVKDTLVKIDERQQSVQRLVMEEVAKGALNTTKATDSVETPISE